MLPLSKGMGNDLEAENGYVGTDPPTLGNGVLESFMRKCSEGTPREKKHYRDQIC